MQFDLNVLLLAKYTIVLALEASVMLEISFFFSLVIFFSHLDKSIIFCCALSLSLFLLFASLRSKNTRGKIVLV